MSSIPSFLSQQQQRSNKQQPSSKQPWVPKTIFQALGCIWVVGAANSGPSLRARKALTGAARGGEAVCVERQG